MLTIKLGTVQTRTLDCGLDSGLNNDLIFELESQLPGVEGHILRGKVFMFLDAGSLK